VRTQTSLDTVRVPPPSWTSIDLNVLDRHEPSLHAPEAVPLLAYAPVDWQIQGLLEALKQRMAELDATKHDSFSSRSLLVNNAGDAADLSPLRMISAGTASSALIPPRRISPSRKRVVRPT
jgi:hypothetical protein